ncbi:hypothetical protein VLK31_34660 [Variovorax sp. H27-G14]|uniref:hypothetical protein n=1 Tax=Variovorax sp. H27-G14 TaxID=3111914 RepID=UPI0038FC93A4
MSPYELWRSASAVTPVRLPMDPNELDVVCSDSVNCTLTTRGIELDNCTFNSRLLQGILRQAPKGANPKTMSVPVQVRVNRSLMAFIWVTDPRTNERLQVPNTDSVKAELSAYQIKVARAMQLKGRDQGQTITIAQAIKRSREVVRSLEMANTQSARRRALKLMTLPPEPQIPTGAAIAAPPARQASSRKHRAANRNFAEGHLVEDVKRQPTIPQDEDIPILATVVRSSRNVDWEQP